MMVLVNCGNESVASVKEMTQCCRCEFWLFLLLVAPQLVWYNGDLIILKEISVNK